MRLNPELSELDGGPQEYPSSVYSAIEQCFKDNCKAAAVIAMHQDNTHSAAIVGASEPSRFLTWTFEQLHEGAIGLTAALRLAGIKAGSTMVTLLPNGADWFLCSFTCVIGRFNLASLDVGALQSARSLELQNFLTLLRPAVVIVADAGAAASVDFAAKSADFDLLLRLTTHWDTNTDIPAGWTDMNRFTSEVDKTMRTTILQDARSDDMDRIAVTLFTSGTSIGRPKGCPRSVLSMLHCLHVTQRADDKPCRRLMDTANFRAICNVCAMSTWYEGGACVISGPAPSPVGVIRAAEECQITDAILVPAILRLVAAHPLMDKEKVSSLTTVVSGGDVVTKSVLDLIHSTFPNAEAYNAHGMSEGGNFFWWPIFQGEQMAYLGEVPSFGFVKEGIRLKVVDENGHVVPRGVPGELHIDTYTTIRHYLQDASPDTFYEQNGVRWMKTGDTTVIDREGHCFILGRTKDVIKRAGVPITPGVIETCLQAYTGSEVVAVAIEHQTLGAEPYAIMSTFNNLSEHDIKERVVEMLGKDYALGGVVTLEQLGFDTWPLNATGKVQKTDLQSALLKYLR